METVKNNFVSLSLISLDLFLVIFNIYQITGGLK